MLFTRCVDSSLSNIGVSHNITRLRNSAIECHRLGNDSIGLHEAYRLIRGTRSAYAETGSIAMRPPNDCTTFTIDPNDGLPLGLKLLYRLSRPTPASLAVCAIPRAFATSPSALWSSLGSPVYAAALRYSMMVSSSSRYSLAPHSLMSTIGGPFWLHPEAAEQLRCPYSANCCRRLRAGGAAHPA